VGRSRLPTYGSGFLLVVLLGAGCQSASGPPPPTVPVTTGASIPPSTAPSQAATSSGICRAPDTLTDLSVTRTDEFPQNQASFVFPDHITSSDATAVADVARAACQLPVLPSGAYSCPADLGVTYVLTFMAGTAEMGTITADPTGCPSLTGLGPTRVAAPSFWDELAVALALPAPREYCDPFRGRLPTAPTQCGPRL
jgi:hypothetical protein